MDYSKLLTDKERFDAINDMPVEDWDVVLGWADDTTDPTYKQIFRSTAHSMAHLEQDRDDTEAFGCS